MTHQYLVVVPRSAPDTLAYLTESFKNVADVKVIVDRRRPSEMPAPPVVERRASDGRRATSEAFGCTLVRIAPSTATPSHDTGAASAMPGAVTVLEPIRLRSLPLLRDG